MGQFEPHAGLKLRAGLPSGHCPAMRRAPTKRVDQ